MANKKEKRENKAAEVTPSKKKKAARFSVLAILVVIALFLLLIAGYSISYSKKVFANSSIGGIDISGKSKAQLSEIITNQSQEFLNQKFILHYKPDSGEAKDYEIIPSDTGLVFDTEATVAEIYGYGRNGNAWQDFSRQLMSLMKQHKFEAIFHLNQEALDTKISDIAAGIDVPEKDYEISYAGEGKFSLSTERQTGQRIDQQGLIDNIKNQISNIRIKEINFATQNYEPKVKLENAQSKLAQANKITASGDLKLVYDEQNFSLDIDTIGGLIKSRIKDDDLELFLDETKTTKQLEAVALSINQAPQNAVLQASNGVVSAFQLSQEGRELDQKQAIVDIGNALLARAADGITEVDTSLVKLTVKVTQPEITSSSLEQYGLKELVATGTTDFRKSPSNRVHNITIGANAINGTLLKPGEEFSTLGKLGAIDASTGYLPELVIKNNKTVPDYGGGLCQVSTTLFRSALNAGMKITSRRNHSYRVSYYEPPVGMDATIFDPSPDFKFINNYSSHILIQSKIVGTKITFEFYGTKDNRQVTISNPDVYDYVEPPAAVYNVDASLPSGTENLLSHSHQGASAKFHYESVRDGEILQSTDFTSKYVALPEIWSVASDSPHAPQNPSGEIPAQ